MPIYPNTSFILSNENTETTITNNYINTPSISAKKINVSNIGSTGQLLTTNGSTLSWITSSNTSIGNSSLNMNNNNINNVNTITCTNLNTTNGNITEFTNNVLFNQSPISPNPTNSNQLATKEYVENKTIYNIVFYLNISQVISTGIYTLSTEMTNSATQTLSQSSTGGGGTITIELGNFISNRNIGTTQIPECLCKLTGFFGCNNTISVYYTICKYSSSGISTVLKTSNTFTLPIGSRSIPQYLYTRLPQTTLLATDKLQIIIYASIINSSIITAYFRSENTLYSCFELQSTSNINICPPPFTTLNMDNYNITSSDNSLSIVSPSITLGSSTDIIITGNTGSNINLRSNNINIFKPLYPIYTLPVSANNIGYTRTINTLTPISLSTGGGSTVIYSFTLPYIGATLYSVTVAVDVRTASANPLNFLRVNLGSASQSIATNQIVIPHIITTGVSHALNCSGVGRNITTSTIHELTIAWTGASGASIYSTSTYFNLHMVRIG